MKNKIFLFTLLLAGSLFAIYSCQKNNGAKEQAPNNTEIITYTKSAAEIKASSRAIIGGNTKQVSKTDYSNTALSALRASDKWKTLIASNQIDPRNVARTYYTNTSISVVTIPIFTNTSDEDYFNIYVKDDKFFVTKVHIVKLANGNTQAGVLSTTNDLYFQLEINPQNKIGHWKFGKSRIPFEEVFMQQQGQIKNKVNAVDPGDEDEEIGGSCSSKPFYECMNCLIIGVCALLCAAALPSCLGGAAAVCILG